MNRSLRKSFGIVTLLALFLAFGEAVWASTCPPMPDSGGPERGSVLDVLENADGAPHAGTCQFADHQHGEDPGRCPLSPAATQGCGAAASLPALSTQMDLPVPTTGTDVVSTAEAHSLLLVHALLRPPRTRS